MFTKIAGITVGLVVLAMCVPCHAVKITNVTTSTLIFEDDFEDDTPGTPPTPASQGPPPPAGWYTGGGDSTVESTTTFPSPGPIQGDNYLWVRDSSNLRVDFAGNNTGDLVHAEWMYNIPSGAEAFDTASPFYFGADGVGGGRTVFYDPDTANNGCGGVWCPAGHTTFLNDEWQRWELDYVVGASTFAITVNGQRKDGLNAQFGSSISFWDNIEFVKRSTQPDIHNYVDGVPADWVDPSVPVPANTFQWAGGELGNWGQPAVWSLVDGASPEGPRANDPAHTAIFPDSSTAPINASTMADVIVNRIEFNNSTQSVVVSGLGSVNLAFDPDDPNDPEDAFGPPSLSVTGSHEFQADVNLQDPTTVDVASNSQLVFDGALNLSGNTLTKTGSGTMAINNVLGSGGGTVDCDDGVCSGSGTIGGSVNNNGGTISPGNSPGVLAIGGDFTQSENGTLLIELGGTDAGAAYDVLEVNGQATLDGILEVSLVDGFAPSAGDTFDIFEFGLTTGDFDDVILPTLAGSLSWDTTELIGKGSLGVVPEPVSCALMAMGMLAAVGYSRQRARTFQLAG